MCPRPCSSMTGYAAMTPCTTPRRFTSMIRSQCASVRSSRLPPTPIPALLHNRSRRPRRSRTSSTTARTASASRTSRCTGETSPRPPSSSFATSCAASPSTSARTTVVPRSARAGTRARPIPDAPPVTIAVAPAKRFIAGKGVTVLLSLHLHVVDCHARVRGRGHELVRRQDEPEIQIALRSDERRVHGREVREVRVLAVDGFGRCPHDSVARPLQRKEVAALLRIATLRPRHLHAAPVRERHLRRDERVRGVLLVGRDGHGLTRGVAGRLVLPPRRRRGLVGPAVRAALERRQTRNAHSPR